MRQLILIKHSRPQRIEGQAPEEWPLSEEGRASAQTLAKRVSEYKPTTILTSEEIKAKQTAEIVASEIGLQAKVFEGLEEHDRSNVPILRSGEFISMMELFFRQPNKLVLGNETAKAALYRFEQAIEEIMGEGEGNVAVVTHGTVLALYLAKHWEAAGFQLWRAMQLPAYAVVEWPTVKMVERVDRV